MSNPYVQTTTAEQGEMLAAVGASSTDQLFTEQIPEELHYKSAFNLPPALSEPEIQREMARLASHNRPTTGVASFLGGGIYDHFIPAAVGALAGRSEFVTSYTPYQPEASQGTLQAFFEFQSMVARLFDMDVSNASLYDGASAAGEALFLALAAKPNRKTVLLPETLHPDYAAVIGTYLQFFDVTLKTVSARDGVVDMDQLATMLDSTVAAVVLQTPNYLGIIENAPEISEKVHAAGALLVAVADPISLALLAPPGSYNADLAVGEGQPLGLRQSIGGETLGLFACKKDFIRKAPGRLVGLTRDHLDRRGYVLTLQTREQHIRREKATSNICTNHAHNALRAAIYMSLMGPQGMQRVARACVRNAHRVCEHIKQIKPEAIAFDQPFFKEFAVKLNRPASSLPPVLKANGMEFYPGVPLDRLGRSYENMLLVCATEQRSDAEIDAFANALGEYL